MTPTSAGTPASDTEPAPPPSAPNGMPGAPRRNRSGRRPGDSGTRDEILAAALRLFADEGYAGTSIRRIANQAGVDPALIHHFFGTKEGLFQAVIGSRMSAASLFDEVEETEEQLTARAADPVSWFVRSYLSFWEDESTKPVMIAIYRTSLADDAATRLLRERIEASMERLAEITGIAGERDANLITALLSAQLLGFAVLRYILKVEPLVSMDFEELVRWATPALRLTLSGPD